MRASNRVNYGPNRGAKNPIITNGTTFPKYPKDKDIFIDNSVLLTFYYDDTSSLWIPMCGGVSVWTAGETLYRGESVYINQSTSTLYKTPVDSDMPIGFVYMDCTSGNPCYFIRSGMAWVLPETTSTIGAGHVMYTSSSEAGRVQSAATLPASTFHFREQGHPLETSTGNGVLTRAIIHHN